jgi:hypothetical protein
VTRRGKRLREVRHTDAVRAWLRERTLVMLQVRREKRERAKKRKEDAV